MHYMSVGHSVDPKQTELWWWSKNRPGRIQRVCPLLGYTKNNDSATHTQVMARDDRTYDLAGNWEWAQGRVDHCGKRVSIIAKNVGLFRLRVINHLLRQAFPGYEVHSFD